MNEIIKITEQDGRQAVSARELYKFLEATERFSNWFERQLQYGFVEGVDYTSVKSFTVVGNGAEKPIDDYALTIDCAKEISMLQRNDRGKQARQYFIAVEKRHRELQRAGGYQVPSSFREALLLAAKQQEQIEEQQKQIESMSTEIVEMKKKTDYLEIILSSRETVTTTQIAADYGMSAKAFNKVLADFKIQRKVNGQWILYAPYISQGYVHSKTIPITRSDGTRDTVMNTEWRQKGRIFLYETLKKNNILPLIERA